MVCKAQSCVLMCCSVLPLPQVSHSPWDEKAAVTGAGQGPQGRASGSAARDLLGDGRCPFPWLLKGSRGGHEAMCSAPGWVPVGQAGIALSADPNSGWGGKGDTEGSSPQRQLFPLDFLPLFLQAKLCVMDRAVTRLDTAGDGAADSISWGSQGAMSPLQVKPMDHTVAALGEHIRAFPISCDEEFSPCWSQSRPQCVSYCIWVWISVTGKS